MVTSSSVRPLLPAGLRNRHGDSPFGSGGTLRANPTRHSHERATKKLVRKSPETLRDLLCSRYRRTSATVTLTLRTTRGMKDVLQE